MSIDTSDSGAPFLRQGTVIYTESGHSFRTRIYKVQVFVHDRTEFVEVSNGFSPRTVQAAFTTSPVLQMTSLRPPFPIKVDNHNVSHYHRSCRNVVRGSMEGGEGMGLYLPAKNFPRKWESGQEVYVHLPTERKNPGTEVPDISELIDELT